MKGKPEVIDFLNEMLSIEVASANQYFMHAKLNESSGYGALGKQTRDEALEEMEHAERIMERILFLGGRPSVRGSEALQIESNVRDQLVRDLETEVRAVDRLNRGLELCARAGDGGTRALLEHILVDEESHVDWLEKQLKMIEEVGVQNYLLAQMGGGAGG